VGVACIGIHARGASACGEGGRTNEEERRVGKREGSEGQRGKSATLATTVTGTANYWLFALSFLGERNRARGRETVREEERKS